MKIDEATLRKRIEQLLELSIGDSSGCSQAFQGALGLVATIHGPTCPQVADLQIIGATTPGGGTDFVSRGSAARGALRNLLGELDAGLLGSLRAQLAGSVIADFVVMARSALAENGEQQKNVAAVLAAAAFEDTIRRMGSELATVNGRPKLADVLEELRKAGHLKDAQFTIAQGYLSFRNNALHADWLKIERESIASVIGFVEGLIMKHFS